jgi:hypothetical protein
MTNTDGKLAYRKRGGLIKVKVLQIMYYTKMQGQKNYWIDSMVGRGITGEKMASA